MMSPSDEERIVAMVDSFTKTVARNFSRNLKRAKANAEKHYGYSCAGVPLFRRNGYRQSSGRKPLFRNRDTALN